MLYLDKEENRTVIFNSVWAALGWHSLRRAADAVESLRTHLKTKGTGFSLSPGLIFVSLIKLLILILFQVTTTLFHQTRHPKNRMCSSHLQKLQKNNKGKDKPN